MDLGKRRYNSNKPENRFPGSRVLSSVVQIVITGTSLGKTGKRYSDYRPRKSQKPKEAFMKHATGCM